MLLVFAHPDDESFAAGGSIAKYAKNGWEVDLVCATAGEAGDNSDSEVRDKDLGLVREQELTQAAEILGIKSVSLLGYKDGSLSQQPPGELEDKIFRQMTEIRPGIVITFDTTGISNHPDHIKISYATTYAFQKYAQWILEMQEDLSIASEPKLYYAALPASLASYLRQQKALPQESFGRPWMGVADKLITTVIDIKKLSNIKKKALLAHKTQQNDVTRVLSLTGNPILSFEYFILRLHGSHEVYMGKNDKISNHF